MELVGGKKIIVLCGGSNGTHVMVADLARRPDFEIRLITRQPSQWQQPVICREQRFLSDYIPYDPLPTWWIEYSGQAHKVFDWSQAHQALQGAHMVLLVCPVAAHRKLLEQLLPALPDHPILLGTIYGQGGFDWHARAALLQQPKAHLVTVFAMKHFPYLCKAQAYGQRVTLYGRFPDLRVCVNPHSSKNQSSVQHILQEMFGKPVGLLEDFVAVTLGGTNQVLHPSICMSLFADYVPGRTVYSRHKKFYAETDRRAGEYMWDLFGKEIPALTQALDTALQRKGRLRKQMGYEIISELVLRAPDAIKPSGPMSATLAWGLRNNKRISQVMAPMAPAGQTGFVPVIDSRFFTDDVPHGLCVLLGLAELLNVNCPRVLYLIRRCQSLMGKTYVTELPDARGCFLVGPDVKETSAPQAFGVHTLETLLHFLSWDRSQPSLESGMLFQNWCQQTREPTAGLIAALIHAYRGDCLNPL